MRQCEFSHGKHLEDITLKGILDVIEIDLGEILAHDLLGGVVDQHVDGIAVRGHMGVDGLLALLSVRQVAGHEETLAAVFLDHLLGVLRVGLFLGEVDDCYICTFTSKEDCDCAANS